MQLNFGKGKHCLPHFYYCSVAKWILQFHSNLLRPGSQIIYYNYHFCNNYFWTCFVHWCAVFHQNNLEQNWGCTMAVLMQPSYSITFSRLLANSRLCCMHSSYHWRKIHVLRWLTQITKRQCDPFHLCLEKSALLYDFFRSAFILDLLESIWQSFSSYPALTKLPASNEETLKMAE